MSNLIRQGILSPKGDVNQMDTMTAMLGLKATSKSVDRCSKALWQMLLLGTRVRNLSLAFSDPFAIIPTLLPRVCPVPATPASALPSGFQVDVVNGKCWK